MKEFGDSKLYYIQEDPDLWMMRLEQLRARLKKMENEINDVFMLAHILNNLPSEYSELVTSLECKDNLDLDTLKIRLCAFWHRTFKQKTRTKRYNQAFVANDNKSEKNEAFYSGTAFKGRCYNCRKFGHKGADCWHKKGNKTGSKDNQSSNENNQGNKQKKWKAKCHYYKKEGHLEAQFYKKKRDEELKCKRQKKTKKMRMKKLWQLH